MMLEVQTKSSLDLYQNCFVKIGRQSSLCDNDFRSSKLKLLARTKTIPLKKYLYRMNMSQTDVCDLCNAEVGEDQEHVFIDCLKFSSLFNLSLMKASVLIFPLQNCCLLLRSSSKLGTSAIFLAVMLDICMTLQEKCF
jgi:hypothetical protein